MSPNSLLIAKKFSLGRGFVKISTNWFFVSTNSNMQSPFWTWSLKKWWFISICFVLECRIGFLDKLIALVYHTEWEYDQVLIHSQKVVVSSKVFVHNNFQQKYILPQQWIRQHYFVFLLYHDTRAEPIKGHVPLVLFLSVLHPEKLESKYPIRL